jgi:hypothetical protein
MLNSAWERHTFTHLNSSEGTLFTKSLTHELTHRQPHTNHHPAPRRLLLPACYITRRPHWRCKAGVSRICGIAFLRGCVWDDRIILQPASHASQPRQHARHMTYGEANVYLLICACSRRRDTAFHLLRLKMVVAGERKSFLLMMPVAVFHLALSLLLHGQPESHAILACRPAGACR